MGQSIRHFSKRFIALMCWWWTLMAIQQGYCTASTMGKGAVSATPESSTEVLAHPNKIEAEDWAAVKGIYLEILQWSHLHHGRMAESPRNTCSETNQRQQFLVID
jgi:hypothetical protein